MQHVDTKTEMARIAASSAVVTVAGLTLNEWVAIFTIVYLSIQCIIMTPKAFMIIKGWITHARRHFKGGNDVKEVSPD